MMDWNDNNITDEMLAAYIDGNATESEKSFIEMMMDESFLLSEAVDIVNDGMGYIKDGESIPLEDLFDLPSIETNIRDDEMSIFNQSGVDDLMLGDVLIDGNELNDIEYNPDDIDENRINELNDFEDL